MSQNYYVLAASSNLKGDSDALLYSVEPSEGGGIEFTGSILEEAEKYIQSVGGTLEAVL